MLIRTVLRALLRSQILVLLAALGLSFATIAPAETLTFFYTDPVADSTGNVDVILMVVVFDSATGNYKITLTSTAAQPFLGEFRVNINLFNPSRLPDPPYTRGNSFFQDVFNDYNLSVPFTKLVLTGTSEYLTHWRAGDLVYTNAVASGEQNPPGGSYYRSAVGNPPFGFLTNEDTIAYGTSGVAEVVPLTA